MRHACLQPRTLVVSLLALLIAIIYSPAASAIESGGVGGKPGNPQADNPRSQSIFIHRLAPGTTTDDAIQVVNNTDQPKDIELYPVDSQASSGGAFACAQKADTATAAGSWIKISQPVISLPPKGKLTVPFTITLPAKADTGEHNACIAIQPKTTENRNAQNGVVLSFRSAIRVAITVPGTITKKLSIPTQSVTSTNSLVRVSPQLRNEGNVSLDTAVSAALSPLFGLGSATNSGTFPVLRDQTTSLNLDVSKPFWGGWYRITTTASYDADTSQTLGQPQRQLKTVQASSTRFIAPQPAAAVSMAVAGALAIAGLVTWQLRRRRSAHALRAGHRHAVGHGEDIQAIAADYDADWKKIAKANRLKPPYSLKPGQAIVIPASHASNRRRA